MKRLTIIATIDERGWLLDPDAEVCFIEPDKSFRRALLATLSEESLDLSRVVLDEVASAEAFLELLAALPRHFTGDLLNVDHLGRGFLSAAGRAGDRVIYALQPNDVRFYLATHGLLRSETPLLGMTA